jgi:hypothetical protein
LETCPTPQPVIHEKLCVRPGKTDLASRRCKLWRDAQPFDPESLVFLDGTGVNTKMARL